MPGFNFCPGCGRNLQASADAFCPGCGYQLRREDRTAPPAPQRPPLTSEPRRPHTWMDTAETPQPVVPLAPTAAAPLATQAPAPPFVPASVFACPSCGGLVARGAFACPRCGRRFPAEGAQGFRPPKPFTEKWLGMLLVAVFAGILIMFFC